jgi:hypothetical protein
VELRGRRETGKELDQDGEELDGPLQQTTRPMPEADTMATPSEQ